MPRGWRWGLERLVIGGGTGLATDAWDAITQVQAAIEAQYPEGNFVVVAAAIDAPLLWNKRGDEMGYRRADNDLRNTIRDAVREVRNAFKSAADPDRRAMSRLFSALVDLSKSVEPANALYGAVLMQGLIVAKHLREKWDLMITETHPKVFRHLLSCVNQPQLAEMVTPLTADLPPQDQHNCESQHEIDATLGAMAAWTAIRCRYDPQWRDLYRGDLNLFNPSGIRVSYWMPMPGWSAKR